MNTNEYKLLLDLKWRISGYYIEETILSSRKAIEWLLKGIVEAIVGVKKISAHLISSLEIKE